MLGKADSPLLNLDWNPKPNHRLRHVRRCLLPLSLTLLNSPIHASSSSSSSSNDATTDLSNPQPQPPAGSFLFLFPHFLLYFLRFHLLSQTSPFMAITVSRTKSTFGRLKVERVRISRPKEAKEIVVKEREKIQPPIVAFDNDSDDGDDVDETQRVNSNRKRSGNGIGSVPRGWNMKYDSQASSQRTKLMATASNFFSRKSFRDAGYSDYMIECLRKLHFHRPSHIQVYQKNQIPCF